MADYKSILSNFELDQDFYVELLTKLIGESEKVQNNPPDLIPQENLVCRHILEALKPYTKEEGGPLIVEHIEFIEGRGNILIKYPGTTDKCFSFVGSHLDVVPANPEGWDRPPFELVREGDKLFGRGTTDCLGHVALVTCLFIELAKSKVQLATTLNAVFIASEEAESAGAGIDGLSKAGKLEPLKPGPIVWIDCADSQPCIGTAGSMVWHLKVKGRLFHSGLPHKGINAIELGSEAVKYLQERFYKDFPAHPDEKKYNFMVSSTMKPTQISVPKGGINQIPPSCAISGDIRLTPFYSVAEVKKTVDGYIADLNKDISVLPTRGPASKYVLPDLDITGSVEIEWSKHLLPGIACKLDSPAYSALVESVKKVKGNAEPFSITGSLPLVGEMQENGFDIQLIGFGLSCAYHADNEYVLLSDMCDALKIISNSICLIEDGNTN